MCDVAKCKGLLLDDWAPREASTRTFEENLQLTNGGGVGGGKAQ